MASPSEEYTSRRPWMLRMCAPLLMLVVVATVVYYSDTANFLGEKSQALSSSTGKYVLLGEKESLAYSDIENLGGESSQSKNVSSQYVLVGKNVSRPWITWLASYPNSGTSYTVSLVERSTNLSTSTNYGEETSYETDDSTPVFNDHPEGPFWGGLSTTRNAHAVIRQLPKTFILTKTHCGGRCVMCPATKYATNATDFLAGCQRTHGYTTINGEKGHHFESSIDTSRIAKVIHLIRNPFHNVVARYHLERHHYKGDTILETRYPYNATGFRRFCKDLDTEYQPAEHRVFSADIRRRMRQVPCRAEFYKYVQWHNRLIEIMSSDQLLFDNKEGDRVLVVYYEDYDTKLEETADMITNFLEQERVLPLRPFRSLPLYEDHYSSEEREAAKVLMQTLATPETWKLIQHYFD